MVAEVIPLKLTPAAAIRIVRKISEDTSCIWFVKHAKQQMRKRKINRTQVYRCLRHGNLTEGPALDVHGYWRCRFERISAGENVKVVTAFNNTKNMLIITVID